MDEKLKTKLSIVSHISRVKDYLSRVIIELTNRSINHDLSKFSDEEFNIRVKYNSILESLPYDCDEYKRIIGLCKPALLNHYGLNRHHPEYHENGIDDMDLFDITEMLCDWKSASEQRENGCIFESIRINSEKFKISKQLQKILYNTAIKLFGDNTEKQT